MAMSDARGQHRRDFETWLQDAGFSLIPEIQDLPGTDCLWLGSISVEWLNGSTGSLERAEHKVAIFLPTSFPYRAPTVVCVDQPPLTPSWHLSPSIEQTLCLWDAEAGWRPYISAQRLLKRIEEWFYHYHTDNWPSDSEMPDLHRYLRCVGVVVTGEEWNPPNDRKDGRFTLWRYYQGDPELHPCIASCGNDILELARDKKPETRLVQNLLFNVEQSKRHSGVWFRLAKPFVPPDSLAELLTCIDVGLDAEKGSAERICRSLLGQELSEPGFPLAIGYTDGQDQEHWLFLWAELSDGNRRKHEIPWSRAERLTEIKLTSFQTAPAAKGALLRRSAYLSKKLSSCKVIVFGLGALGSSVALLLAKAGIGEIRLVDHDVVMPGNAMRHICGLNLTGLPKTVAVKLVVSKHNPDCNVLTLSSSWEAKQLRSYMEGCDIVVDTTANYNFSLYLNELCVTFDHPVIFATTYRRASIGRVIVHRDSNDPCLACYADAPRFWAEHDYPIIPPSFDHAFIEDGCGAVTEEAVALDVEAVANLTARTTIKVTQGEFRNRNLAVLVNEVNPDVEGILAQEGVHWRQNKRLAKCSICRS